MTSEEFKLTTDDGTFISLVNDKVFVKTKSGLEIVSEGSKFTIKNEEVNFAEVMASFLNILMNTTPSTQGSPAAQNFNPAIITAISDLKDSLAKLFK